MCIRDRVNAVQAKAATDASAVDTAVKELGQAIQDFKDSRIDTITPHWVQEGGSWRYQNADGRWSTNTWQYIDKKWYHFDNGGYMQTGWLLDGKTWYYLKSSGAMATGWLLDGKTWYYLKGNGGMATGWLLDGRTWYYLKSNGAMATGWVKVSGKWYYLRANGAMASKTWIGKYYVNGSGVWTKTR